MLVFPVVVGGVLGGAMWALDRGASIGRVTTVAFIVSAVVVGLLERWLPYRRAWNRSHGDVGLDSVYLALAGIAQGLVSAIATLLVIPATTLVAHTGLVVPRWPVAWPLAAQFALATVYTEFFDYWAHRVMHEIPRLWRFHRVHHGVLRLYWLNAPRAHPVEMLLRGALGTLPLALLQPDARLVALLAIANMVVGFFQHANVDFRLGPLSYAFSVGALHRWHHSSIPAEANRNYGSNFMWWDVVFGTRFLPAHRAEPAAYGFDDVERFPQTLAAQLAEPFR